jgi:branched-chain amino acid aminotransferase
MIVFLNGQFLPEERAVVSVFDRGFLYGDGIFETMRVLNGHPFRWAQHWERLQRGAAFLKIPVPVESSSLRASATQLITTNEMPDSLLRIALSRGVGRPGYSPKEAQRPSLVMSCHPAPFVDPQRPPRWKLVSATVRLPANEPLAQFKTANKLAQIVARAEADGANADEALLCNTDGHVVESTSGNLFWIDRDAVCTPPLAGGILPGVTRAVVLEVCRGLRLPAREASIVPGQLRLAQAVFLSLSSWGVVEAVSLDGVPLREAPWVARIRQAYWDLVQRETTSPKWEGERPREP